MRNKSVRFNVVFATVLVLLVGGVCMWLPAETNLALDQIRGPTPGTVLVVDQQGKRQWAMLDNVDLMIDPATGRLIFRPITACCLSSRGRRSSRSICATPTSRSRSHLSTRTE